jgi:AcrR family transcriptional regulator
MTPDPEQDSPRRTRDAARSKRALLAAGSQVFAARGYSRARLRDIADIAGIDAALVIRYFGSKAGLYRAVLELDQVEKLPLSQPLGSTTVDDVVDELVTRALGRWEADGIGALALSLSRPDADLQIREAVYERLSKAILEPLAAAAADAGHEDPRLRAEVALATLVGIGTIRSLGSLNTLAEADRQALEPVLRAALRAALAD